MSQSETVVTDATRVAFFQPLVHRFGLQRTEMLHAMFKSIEKKIAQQAPCAVHAVIAPGEKKFGVTCDGFDNPHLLMLLGLLIADEGMQRVVRERRAKNFQSEQIVADVITCRQVQRALATDWKLFDFTYLEVQKAPPLDILNGLLDTIQKALEDVEKENPRDWPE